jgi:hypothetical protein
LCLCLDAHDTPLVDTVLRYYDFWRSILGRRGIKISVRKDTVALSCDIYGHRGSPHRRHLYSSDVELRGGIIHNRIGSLGLALNLHLDASQSGVMSDRTQTACNVLRDTRNYASMVYYWMLLPWLSLTGDYWTDCRLKCDIDWCEDTSSTMADCQSHAMDFSRNISQLLELRSTVMGFWSCKEMYT